MIVDIYREPIVYHHVCWSITDINPTSHKKQNQREATKNYPTSIVLFHKSFWIFSSYILHFSGSLYLTKQISKINKNLIIQPLTYRIILQVIAVCSVSIVVVKEKDTIFYHIQSDNTLSSQIRYKDKILLRNLFS